MFVFCFIIFIVAIRWLIKEPHKMILAYGIVNIFLQDYVCFRFEPPAIMLRLVLDTIIIWYFCSKRVIDLRKFPLKVPYFLLFVITIVGIFISPLPVTQTFPAAISKITPYLIVVLFFNQLQTKEDTEYAYKFVLWSFGILCLYAFIEFLLQMNPVGEYLKTVVSEDLLRGKIYVASEFRYISVRCSSLLGICIAWGGYCCLIVSCFLCISGKSASKTHIVLMIALLIFNVIISGSRAPMIYLAVIALGYFGASKISVKLLLTISFSAFFIFNQELIIPILSSFSEDNSEVSGSSIDMRLDQYAAVSSVISESPIWGFGVKGYEVAKESNSEILGAESIWLQQLIYGGVIGIIYQILIYITVLRYMVTKTNKSTRLACVVMVVGWIVFASLTSSPGLIEPYFLTICILVIRYFELHNNHIQAKPLG